MTIGERTISIPGETAGSFLEGGDAVFRESAKVVPPEHLVEVGASVDDDQCSSHDRRTGLPLRHDILLDQHHERRKCGVVASNLLELFLGLVRPGRCVKALVLSRQRNLSGV